jgi:hypothetical protein
MATPPSPPPQEPADREIHRRRRGRNIAMLVVLLAMSALFYAIAIVKLGHNAIRSF